MNRGWRVASAAGRGVCLLTSTYSWTSLRIWEQRKQIVTDKMESFLGMQRLPIYKYDIRKCTGKVMLDDERNLQV